MKLLSRPLPVRRLAVRSLSVVAAAGASVALIALPADASSAPSVSGLSAHSGAYWGGQVVTVSGRNFNHVKSVRFGSAQAWSVHVLSSTRLTAMAPYHGYGTIHVRVVTSTGWSTRTNADKFTFARPTMNSHIQGGYTGRQEQQISAKVRAAHRGVHTAYHSKRWTPAMGVTAMQRARSWIGLPYSWAGGNAHGPTKGVCSHNGGDLDCHIVGFDCSGLTLYSWAPYKTMAHYAQTQHSQAGRFHPSIGQLMPGDLVFFSAYIAGGIGHVGIYEGKGMVIEAPQSGSLIRRSKLTDMIRNDGTYRGATRPTSTGRQGAGPRVTTATSQVSTKGGYVTITGSNLSGAQSVVVGGQRTYSFVQRSWSKLVVKAPAHRSGVSTVSVSNAWNTASRHFTYVGAPTQTSLSPSRGTTAGATTVTIAGHNFYGVTKVTFDRTAVRFRVLSSGRITATTPAHVAGPVRVTVYGRFGTSNPLVYTYLPPVVPAAKAPAPKPAPTTSSRPATPAPSTPATNAPSTPQPSSSAPTTAEPTGPSDGASTPADSTPAESTPGEPTPAR